MAPAPAAASGMWRTSHQAAAFFVLGLTAGLLMSAVAPATSVSSSTLRDSSRESLLAQLAAAQASMVALKAAAEAQAAELSLVKEAAAGAAAAAARSPPPPRELVAAADGCYHVYVDVGTNVAVQVHKLWDPALLLASGPDPWGREVLVQPYYDRYFGPAPRADVCAFGFEPNPNHSALLRRTVAHYAAADLRMTIFEAGAGTFDGMGVVKSDGDAANNEWATSITPLAAGETPPPSAIVIPIKDMISWIVPTVINRRVPPAAGGGARPPAIVMKLDAEGTEDQLLTALLDAGALCHIAFVYCDTLMPDFSARLDAALKERKCDTVVMRVDDESYHAFRPPWEHTDAATEKPWKPVPPPIKRE